MSAGSCCSWSWASRATRGPRWSTSCCGHDVACDDDAGRLWGGQNARPKSNGKKFHSSRHDTTLMTPVVTLQAAQRQRPRVGSRSEARSEASRGEAGKSFTTMSSAFEPVSATPWSASAPHAHGRDTGKHQAPRRSSAHGASHVFEPVCCPRRSMGGGLHRSRADILSGLLLTAGNGRRAPPYRRREPRRAVAAKASRRASSTTTA